MVMLGKWKCARIESLVSSVPQKAEKIKSLDKGRRRSMRTWSEDHPKARLLERKQEAIKVAAKDLFLQHGYANTTMEMVAAQAVVSIMTLYRHFRGKDVLLQAVLQQDPLQQVKRSNIILMSVSPFFSRLITSIILTERCCLTVSLEKDAYSETRVSGR